MERVRSLKPRLLVVGAFPPRGSRVFGGILTSCRRLLSSTFPERFDLVLVDSTQISNPPPAFTRRLLFSMQRLSRFLRALLRSRPDAVLLFAATGMSLAEKGVMAWTARLAGIPVLVFPRGGGIIPAARTSSFHRLWIRWSFGGATKVLCQGPAWRTFALQDLGFSEEDAPLIPNWTASEPLLSVGQARVHGSSAAPVRLIFVGWLEREKGIFELLRACADLVATHQFVLTIVGRGHAEEEARSFVESEGLSSVVSFTGWVDYEGIPPLLARSDVFVLPSWAEGLPNAMIEAMAAGLAVVVTSVGTIPEIVTDCREALLVPPRDSDALRATLDRVIRDPQLRQALGSRGYELARSNFGLEPAIDRLERVILETMQNEKTVHGDEAPR